MAHHATIGRSLTYEKVEEIPFSIREHMNRNYFTNLAYLNHMRYDRIIFIEMASDADINARRKYLFIETKEKIVCCNRLESIAYRDILHIERFLFEISHSNVIVFEDVEYKGVMKFEAGRLMFSYQGNWHKKISNSEEYLSKRRRSVLRRRMKKFHAHVSGKIRFEFGRSVEDDVESIVNIAKKTFEFQGRKYKFPPEKRRILSSAARCIGYTGKMKIRNELVAAELVIVIEKEAWFKIGAYDHNYREFSPGMQLHSYVIEELKKIGVEKVNFLWGDSEWKKDVGGTKIDLTTILVTRNFGSWFSMRTWSVVGPYTYVHLKTEVKAAMKRLKRMISGLEFSLKSARMHLGV